MAGSFSDDLIDQTEERTVRRLGRTVTETVTTRYRRAFPYGGRSDARVFQARTRRMRSRHDQRTRDPLPGPTFQAPDDRRSTRELLTPGSRDLPAPDHDPAARDRIRGRGRR